MKKLILHIGRHKTGTTSLQRNFYFNRDAMKKCGLYYPERGVRDNAHHLISERINPRQLRSEKNHSFLKDYLITSFIEEMNCCEEETILVSSEGFQNCNPVDVRRLFEKFNVTIIFYIREQVSYLKSSYLQEVHASNYSESIYQFESDRFSADYFEFYKRWANIFVSENVITRVYSRNCLIGNDIAEDFFYGVLDAQLGFSVQYESPDLDGFSSNTSLSGFCIPFKMRLNSVASVNVSTGPILYQTLGRFSQKIGGSSDIVDRHLAEKIAKKYSESNKKLLEILSLSEDVFLSEKCEKGKEIIPLGPKIFFKFTRNLIQFEPKCGYLYAECFSAKVSSRGDFHCIKLCQNIVKDSLNNVYLNSKGKTVSILNFQSMEDGSFIVPKKLFELNEDSIELVFDNDIKGILVLDKGEEEYNKRIEDQIKQFSDLTVLKKLPPIHRYWMSTHIVPKIKDIFGTGNALEIYVDNFVDALTRQGDTKKILSIGAGDSQLEISIVKKIRDRGVQDFSLVCTDLSSIRLDRAKERAKSEGVLDLLEFRVVDVNAMDSGEQFAGVMAHHTLHHIVELEQLFYVINEMLHDDGVFVSIDMIGRNGHMRWSEAESLIERMWEFIPDSYKYQHQFGKQHEQFLNWDCAQKGFEGIRAQDILPLLIEYFDFETFFSYGNLPDIFVERGYGHNFDIDNSKDKGFIDFVEYLNELLIDVGYLKPTIMFATMRKKGKCPGRSVYYKHWTPEFCVHPILKACDLSTSTKLS